MRIKIKATNMELTSAISSYVEEKLKSVEKFASAHKNEEPLVEVELGKVSNHHHSGEVFRAETNLSVRGKQFRAVSEQADLYAAIDDMRNELVRELNSHKDKARTLLRRGAGMIKNLLRFGKNK
jgi:putative sigma-54 modulation protein